MRKSGTRVTLELVRTNLPLLGNPSQEPRPTARLRGLSDFLRTIPMAKSAAKPRPPNANVTYQVRYSAVANMPRRRPPTICLRARPEFHHQQYNPIFSAPFSYRAT